MQATDQQKEQRARWLAGAKPVEAELYAIMTASEVEAEYGVNRHTVIIACRNGWIAARQSGATWLVRRVDAERRWGERASAPPQSAAG